MRKAINILGAVLLFVFVGVPITVLSMLLVVKYTFLLAQLMGLLP